MSPTGDDGGTPRFGVGAPQDDVEVVLAEHRRSRARADQMACRQVIERLRDDPSPTALRDDLEDALFQVAAHAVTAMVELREQRAADSVDADAVAGHVHDGALALRTAEVTAAVLSARGCGDAAAVG